MYALAWTLALSPCMGIAMQQQEPHPDKCVICQYELSQKKFRTLTLKECGHKFHPECIMPWAKENRTCPLCRTASTITISKGHLEALDHNILKAIMQEQNLKILNFSVLPAKVVKKYLLHREVSNTPKKLTSIMPLFTLRNFSNSMHALKIQIFTKEPLLSQRYEHSSL